MQFIDPIYDLPYLFFWKK